MGKYDHLDNEKILELARKGISKRAASEQLSIPFSSFKTFLNKRGISTEYTELSQKASKRILSQKIYGLYVSGVPIEKIAKILESEIETIVKNLNHHVTIRMLKPALCEKCNGKNTYSYGSGRFCSNDCARSFSTSLMGHESIRKRNNGLLKGRATQSLEWEKYHDATNSGLKIEMPYKRMPMASLWTEEQRKEHSRLLLSKWSNSEFKEKHVRQGFTHSLETRKKISEARKKAIANGSSNAWGRRQIESYPEKYFREILTKNGISFQQEYRIVKKDYDKNLTGSYFLDFYIEINGTKIDLEIDGSHHWLIKDRAINDARRDEFMKSIGFRVYRIKWNNPKNDGGKMQTKIEDLLEFLKNFE